MFFAVEKVLSIYTKTVKKKFFFWEDQIWFFSGMNSTIALFKLNSYFNFPKHLCFLPFICVKPLNHYSKLPLPLLLFHNINTTLLGARDSKITSPATGACFPPRGSSVSAPEIAPYTCLSNQLAGWERQPLLPN